MRTPSIALAALLLAATVGAQAPPPIPCPLFPPDNVWNADVSALPVHANSAAYVASIGATTGLHPDFGAGLYRRAPIGIPYTVVPSSTPRVTFRFRYADESDAGPYPIPRDAPIEGGKHGKGDRHVLAVESGACALYEVFDFHSKKKVTAKWKAGSGAIWDLGSNALRTADFTSADAAGLPILPGLARYDEILAGAITHALRFTVSRSQRAYLWPARHFASSSTDPSLPPMGLRLRLKASVDISGYSPTNQIILTALKTYGMFVADNGSDWFISGVPDDRWNNDDLHLLNGITGADFEAVDESGLMVDPDSGQAQ
jgi:hypothetical protein